VVTPAFVDTAYAADMLRIPQDTILGWIDAGKLKTYGGRVDNPFVRTPEVTALAEQLGVAPAVEAPKRSKSASARVQTRLTADSRWKDVTPSDISEWAARADPARRQAARRVAEEARERLEMVMKAIQEANDARNP
jgi:hypothetical protein